MLHRINWLAVAGAILVIGTIPLALWGYGWWSRWEARVAPRLAARVLADFSAPCDVPDIDLRCDVAVTALPRGAYSFVVVDTMPFEGVFVRVRYATGAEVALDVFPTFIGRSRVHLVSVEQ